MTLDPKALEAAWRAAFPHHPVEPNRMEDLTAGIEAYLAASRSSAIVEEPSGWKLVPVEPTEVMRAHGQWTISDNLTVSVCVENNRKAADIYGAMLAAAPPSPQPHTGRAGVTGWGGKYGEVLTPFVTMMEAELHANSGKGDRPGWLAMSREALLLEIYYHLAKMQKATLKDEADGIREFGADVANMAMMLVDKCGALPVADALNAALTVEPEAGEVTVKPLEWRWAHDKLDEALSSFGLYQVRAENDGTFWWEFRIAGADGRGLGFRTKDEAKAAAQADYTARIRSALAP